MDGILFIVGGIWFIAGGILFFVGGIVVIILVEKIHEFSLLNLKIDSGICSKTPKTGMTILAFSRKMCHTSKVWHI